MNWNTERTFHFVFITEILKYISEQKISTKTRILQLFFIEFFYHRLNRQGLYICMPLKALVPKWIRSYIIMETSCFLFLRLLDETAT